MKTFLTIYLIIGIIYCIMCLIYATTRVMTLSCRISAKYIVLVYLVCLLDIIIWPIETITCIVNFINSKK